MQASIIVAIISALVSVSVCLLTLRSQARARAQDRADKAREVAKAKRDRDSDDTVTLRVKKLESADEFRAELTALWRESRDGWAKCEADRTQDKLESLAQLEDHKRESAGVIARLEAEISALGRELMDFKRKLEGVGYRSEPPPARA